MNQISSNAQAATGQDSRLAHFPVALFSTVMGLAGLSLAWMKAHHVAGAPAVVGELMGWIATAVFVFLICVYGLKLVRHPAAVMADYRHPIRLNFLPAISIGLILLAMIWSESVPPLAAWLLAVGAALHLAFTLLAMSSWIHHTHYDIKHANPAWFIPVVGNILVPIAGVRFAPVEVSWFFFSVGLVFWLMLMTIVLYRLFFHEPLPARLTPTLFILLAPPSVGFVSYLALTGSLDGFARMLFYTALFLTLLLASNAVRFLRLPFFISAWAYSFPLAAMTIACFTMAQLTTMMFFQVLALFLLAVLTLLLVVLVFKTLLVARQGRICVPE